MKDLWPSWIERGFGVDVTFRPVECDYDDEDDEDYENEQSEKLTNVCFRWTCRT